MNTGNDYGFEQLVDLCKQTHQEMQLRAGRSVDIHLEIRNWLFGWYIVEYEQNGCDRAEYGTYLIKRLSEKLGEQLGRGFSARSLEQCRKFYLVQKQIPQTMSEQLGMEDNTFPLKKYLTIPQTVSAISDGTLLKADGWQDVVTELLKRFSLGWSHYVTLMTIENTDERRFYEIEATQNHWNVRELERQISSSLYERLALSRNKEEIRRLTEQGLVVETAADLIKNPLVLEFLDMEEKLCWSENDLESAIIDRLETFLLELGKGFLFEGRQKRFTFDNDHFYIDLVFSITASFAVMS
jgi:predicted nuclease of restriction endonuclease-like (RecB) superfamily